MTDHELCERIWSRYAKTSYAMCVSDVVPQISVFSEIACLAATLDTARLAVVSCRAVSAEPDGGATALVRP